jgi:hypothetical protein
MCPSNDTYEAFTSGSRYSTDEFQGIMPDTGASGISSGGERQIQALMKLDPTIQINRTDVPETLRFGKGTTTTERFVTVRTPIREVKFWVVETDTPLLMCIQDMDRLGIQFDNLTNVIVQGKKKVPVVRKWGHPWMLIDQMRVYSH